MSTRFVARRAAKLLISTVPKIEVIYLTGSSAKSGAPSPRSDVDLLILHKASLTTEELRICRFILAMYQERMGSSFEPDVAFLATEDLGNKAHAIERTLISEHSELLAGEDIRPTIAGNNYGPPLDDMRHRARKWLLLSLGQLMLSTPNKRPAHTRSIAKNALRLIFLKEIRQTCIGVSPAELASAVLGTATTAEVRDATKVMISLIDDSSVDLEDGHLQLLAAIAIHEE